MHIERGLRDVEPEQFPIRRCEDALAEFLLHHVAFGSEVGLVNDQRAHALGLAPQHALEMIGRHGLVVVGEVVPGRCVVEAADVLGEPVHRFGRHVRGRLEHDVFEEVGEARPARRIVFRADIVPDGHGDAGGVGIGHRVDAQAVLQLAELIFQRLDREAACAGPARIGLACGEGEARE
jgi:hypothetical protein